MARHTKPTIPTSQIPRRPCFRRSIFNPRRPCSIHPSLHNMYIPISKLPPPSTSQDSTLISRIYYVTAEQLNHMQSLANSNNAINSGVLGKRTKLESFCAFLWKMVAAAAASDSSVDGGKRVIAKMGIVVDGRKRLSNGVDKGKAALMGSYFGNVLSIPFGGKPVEELMEKPLKWVADQVHEFLEIAMTEEHFLGLIDWVEAHRPVPGLARIYCYGTEEGPAIVVSSGQRFPESKVDFGWGKAVFASYHFPWGGSTGYVMPMPSPLGNGDWVLYMHLLKEHIDIMESEAARVFKPLNWDYLINH